MADVTLKNGETIGAVNTFYVSGAAQPQAVATLVCELVSSSFSGSVTVKARAAGSSQTPQAIAYYDYTTGAYSTAAITGTKLIAVPNSGLDVCLDCTSYTSGSLTYRGKAVVGAAA